VAMVIKSLSMVTVCPVCGDAMSTMMTCDACDARMCCGCGKKHKCEKGKVSDDGELHSQHSEG
jgi:hypothetical protein